MKGETRRLAMKAPILPESEQRIAAVAARTGVRLRYDKVALRVIGSLRASLADEVPEEEAVLFTVTAPVRLPAKTVAAMESLVQGRLPGTAQIEDAIHGNAVRLRWIKGVQAHMPKAIGFVHNPDPRAERLLDIVAAWLVGPEAPIRGAADSN